MKFQLATAGTSMNQLSTRLKTGTRPKATTAISSEKDGSKRTKRRGSVDSAILATNKYTLPLPSQREKSSLSDTTDKRRNSFTHTGRRDKDHSNKESAKVKATRTSSLPSPSSSSSSSSSYVTCESELKPILKSCPRINGLHPTVSLDDALSSEKQHTQTAENKFSYRLPDASKKTTIRKSVSFREDSQEDFHSKPRRFSTPAFELSFSPTKTICPDFVDPI